MKCHTINLFKPGLCMFKPGLPLPWKTAFFLKNGWKWIWMVWKRVPYFMGCFNNNCCRKWSLVCLWENCVCLETQSHHSLIREKVKLSLWPYTGFCRALLEIIFLIRLKFAMTRFPHKHSFVTFLWLHPKYTHMENTSNRCRPRRHIPIMVWLQRGTVKLWQSTLTNSTLANTS